MPDPLTEIDALTLERHHEVIERAAEAIGKWAWYKLERDAYEQQADGPGPTAADILDEGLDSPPHGDPLWQRCAGLAQQIAEERGLVPKWGETRRGKGAQGEAHGLAKLTEDEAVAIFIESRQDGRTQVEIAEEYGINPKTVSSIKNRRIWKHATDAL